MKVTELDTSKVIPYSKNPRINKDAVKFVVNSIEKFGFQQPIVVDKTLTIIVGHTRFLAAKHLGFQTVPVVIAENLTDEQVRAYRLADNKVAEKSYWDGALLRDELQTLSDIGYDMEEFAFEHFEMGSAFEESDSTVIPDDIEDENVNVFSASLKIEFGTAEEQIEALKYFGINQKIKKLSWSELKNHLK